MVMPCSRSASKPSVSNDRSTVSIPRRRDAASIALDPGTPLVGIAGCVALDDARAEALPGPTRTPEPTETPAPSEPAADPDEPAVQG